jgi:hypothetical protein
VLAFSFLFQNAPRGESFGVNEIKLSPLIFQDFEYITRVFVGLSDVVAWHIFEFGKAQCMNHQLLLIGIKKTPNLLF